MRAFKVMAVIGLAVSTAACVESVDSNYGYSDGYYAPNQGYYAAQPAYYAPTYYAPTQVVTQTRYVPVPAAMPQHTFTPQAQGQSQTHTQNSGHEHERPQASNTPTAQPQQPATNNQHRGTSTSNGHTSDGRPDRNS